MSGSRDETEREVRELLERILDALKEPSTCWYTGEVDFTLATGPAISGELRHLEDAAAIISGPRGLQSVVLKNVIHVSPWMTSPGPE